MLRQRRLEDDLLELSAIKVKLSSLQRASRYLALFFFLALWDGVQVDSVVADVGSYETFCLEERGCWDYKMGETREVVGYFPWQFDVHTVDGSEIRRSPPGMYRNL